MASSTTRQGAWPLESAPRCPNCDYVLLGLSEHRCPECGEAFDPEILSRESVHAHLLPWEKREAGGVVLRLLKTALVATFSSRRFYAHVRMRREYRIAGAGKLLIGCVVLAVCLHLLGIFLDFFQSYQRASASGRPLSAAFRSFLGHDDKMLPFYATFVVANVTAMLLAGCLMASLLRWLHRSRLGSLRVLDLIVLFSPAAVSGSFLFVVARFLPRVWGYLGVSGSIAALVQPMFLMVFVSLVCQHTLGLNKWKSGVFFLLTMVVGYGIGFLALLIPFGILLRDAVYH